MRTVLDFKARKAAGPKIAMVSAYTHWEARYLAASPVDCILVGDSLSVVLDGESQTFAATTEIMCRHTAAGEVAQLLTSYQPNPARVSASSAIR